MAEPTDDDIIIAIADAIRHFGAGRDEFSVEYSSVAANFGIPEAAVPKHLEAAAADTGYEVTRKGGTRASLRRKRPGAFVA